MKETSIKNLSKATSCLEKIKKLDQEIIKLDRYAMALANDDITSKFKLEGRKVKDESEKVSIDEDGSLKYGDSTEHFTGFFSRIWQEARKEKEVENDFEIDFEIDEKTTLQLLGVLIFKKQSERESLINQLQKLGFKL